MCNVLNVNAWRSGDTTGSGMLRHIIFKRSCWSKALCGKRRSNLRDVHATYDTRTIRGVRPCAFRATKNRWEQAHRRRTRVM
eukprot:6018896-Pyramimonas_sp.AAC.2